MVVTFEDHLSLKHCLERAIRKVMESDPYMKSCASAGFFMLYQDEFRKQSVEVDDETRMFEVDMDHPIEIMRFDSIDLVSTRTIWLQVLWQADSSHRTVVGMSLSHSRGIPSRCERDRRQRSAETDSCRLLPRYCQKNKKTKHCNFNVFD